MPAFEYEVTRDDILAHLRQRYASGTRWWLWNVAQWFVMYGMIGIFVATRFRHPNVVWITFITVTVVVVAVGATVLLLRIEILRFLQRHVNNPIIASDYGSYRIVLSEDGIREYAPVVESFVKWESVKAVRLDDQYLTIELDGGKAAVVSRRSYSGPIRIEDVPALVERYKQGVLS